MPISSTIIIIREDFSIPHLGEEERLSSPEEAERLFFALVQRDRPDVVVLDLGPSRGAGHKTIRKIRERCKVPIIVVCPRSDPNIPAYRLVGATECLFAPVDIGHLNVVIQEIIRLRDACQDDAPWQGPSSLMPGVHYFPERNMLRRDDGLAVKLTTSERDLLSYFLQNSRRVCSRADISDVLYGQHRPFTDRAVDVLVNRLRKKLASACGPEGTDLIKTEFRRGYMFWSEESGGGCLPI
ncbi:MAG: response regulator transcription factor [Clostridiaceae bacterium]|nr:response regulator transcription factor [Clostridiaceae bacterium]